MSEHTQALEAAMARGEKFPPWTPGLPQSECVTCGLLVVATTLDEVGDCVPCAHSLAWAWKRQQLVLPVAA